MDPITREEFETALPGRGTAVYEARGWMKIMEVRVWNSPVFSRATHLQRLGRRFFCHPFTSYVLGRGMETRVGPKNGRLPEGWNLGESETTVEGIMDQCPIAFKDLEDRAPKARRRHGRVRTLPVRLNPRIGLFRLSRAFH